MQVKKGTHTVTHAHNIIIPEGVTGARRRAVCVDAPPAAATEPEPGCHPRHAELACLLHRQCVLLPGVADLWYHIKARSVSAVSGGAPVALVGQWVSDVGRARPRSPGIVWRDSLIRLGVCGLAGNRAAVVCDKISASQSSGGVGGGEEAAGRALKGSNQD